MFGILLSQVCTCRDYRYIQLITNHLALTRQMAAWSEDAEDFEVISEPYLSICCFCFVPPDLKLPVEETESYLNGLNQAIEAALVEDGRALVSGTQLNGKRALRTCIVNHRVTWASVTQTLQILRGLSHQLDGQLRSQNR